MYETITPNIMVENVAETIQFYEEKLGFKKVLSVPEEGEALNFAIVCKDTITIMFQEKQNLIEEYPSLKVEQIKPTFTLFITVQDVSELYQSLNGKVELAKELHQTFYGKDEFAIFDNNKNILTISN
ncbi:MAG: bleomycin resistance family protein [Bacilli bacterium]|nr:bleomycin resistance family protein [Bacilli bacterium]